MKLTSKSLEDAEMPRTLSELDETVYQSISPQCSETHYQQIIEKKAIESSKALLAMLRPVYSVAAIHFAVERH
jgi:hypothetical protein